MNPEPAKKESDRLVASRSAKQADFVEQRQRLIESLGDSMCGSGSGPDAGEVALLAELAPRLEDSSYPGRLRAA